MKYCLIGEKLSHSYSAEIHKRLGIDYSLKEIPKGKLEDFIKSCDYDGFNVTIPYKKVIMPFLSEIKEEALKIGAVNTVLKKDGKLIGYNTDVSGFELSLKKSGVSLKDKNVLILGSGGAAAVARYAAEKQNAKTVIGVSRSGKINYDNVYELKDTQVIINATPVGTFPDIFKTPVIPENFPCLEFAFDMIYNPLKTEFLCRAESVGAKISSGLYMLTVQAIKAEEIWGKTLSENTITDVYSWLYRLKSNLTLIGMPSCGKTTLGKILAEKLNKTFVDTDEKIYKETGKTPETIINEQGEAAFRNIESAIIKKTSELKGLIIATGGGAVTREENINALKKNGIICYVKRDLSLLSEEYRPISKNKGAAALFAERNPLYEKYCDFSADNNGDILSAAKEIVKEYENTCNKRA